MKMSLIFDIILIIDMPNGVLNRYGQIVCPLATLFWIIFYTERYILLLQKKSFHVDLFASLRTTNNLINKESETVPRFKIEPWKVGEKIEQTNK